MKKYILSLFVAVVCGATMFAQTDSRHRVASTIVADGLAQLPAQNPKTFASVMSEMAATGEQGILQIAGNLKPVSPQGTKNAVFEYALSGIVDYVTSQEGKKYQDGVRSGLVKAVDKVGDDVNKTFVLKLLTRVATPAEFPVFAKYLGNEKLSIPCLYAIEQMKGVDGEALNLVKTATNVPRYSLAKIVEARKLKGVEDLLISWTKGADAKTLNAIYDALAATGSQKSFKLLQSAAKSAGFAPDDSRALDAYIRMLNDNSDAQTVKKAAKALMKAGKIATRCAGLRLMLKALSDDDAKAVKTAVKALGDKDIQYRNTALIFAPQYAGSSFASAVAKNFNKLSTPAKVDVLKWFGNNHDTARESLVLSSMSSSEQSVALAAIEAAAKLGTPASLEALIKQTTGRYGENAAQKLLSFNGDIATGVSKALSSAKDAKTLVPVLKLAGQRHIHSVYSKVAQLASSSDNAVSAAAYEALAGVASAATYSDVASLLDKSTGERTAKLQKALCNSLAAQTASEQYAKASQSMKQSSHPEYYYPLLAQAGTKEALADLQKALSNPSGADAAASALLTVDNPDVLPVLLTVAKSNASKKDAAANRYIALVNKNIGNPVEKYLSLQNVLDLNPSDAITKRVISDLGTTRTVQALAVVASKLNDSKHAYPAALAVKDILGHVASLNGGDDVRKALNKAKEVAAAKKATGDADAGYAVDEINGILAKTASNGFTLNTGIKQLEKGEKLALAKNQENMALTLDWKTAGEGTLVLRSIPVISLSAENGVQLLGSKKKVAAKGAGEWNTLEVRLVDDRLFVTSNGVKLVENEVLKNAAGISKSVLSGAVEIKGANGEVAIRNCNFNALPATPVYTLSPEEKKAGFELLFDGHSLDKWQGNTVNYTPDNGTIYVTANYGGSGNLYTKKKYSDFVYRFEFCFVQPGVNNGIGIRTKIGTDAAYEGMEIQVLDHDDPIYANLAPYQQHGSVYGIIVPKHVKFGKLGTWNTEEIRAVGDHITVTVNGQVITDGNIREACKGHNVVENGRNPYTVDHNNHPGLFNKDGYISFCGHGPGVRFRNVRILDLSKKGRSSRRR